MALKWKFSVMKVKFILIKERKMQNKDQTKKYEISVSTVSIILKSRDSVIKNFENVGDRKRFVFL